MELKDGFPRFSMSGGPLHLLGRRAGLVKAESDTLRLGFALGLLLWAVLMTLATFEGLGARLFSLSHIAVHVRFLAVIPLLFFCETIVFPRMAEFADYVVRSGLTPNASLPALESEIRSACKLVGAGWIEGMLLLIAAALPLVELVSPLPGTTASWTFVQHSAGDRLPWTVGWYLGFALPVFRFLQLRWLWRLFVWWRFLWRLDRLNLQLIPTHSDGAGGLGYLSIVHENFTPLVAAVSATCSAQLAEDVAAGNIPFDALYNWVLVILLLCATVFIAPLGMFYNALWRCRVTGMREYMAMASRYAIAFDRKWVHGGPVTGESQLGAADLQSLADLTNSINVIRGMKTIPIGRRQVTQLAASGIAPCLPLLLLKYPVDEMAVKLFQLLTGL